MLLTWLHSRRGLDAGLEVLAEDGATAVRIDRLASRLGLSKGSFYHHFPGISAYRLDLLAHYEQRCTLRYIDQVEAHEDLSPRQKLALLQSAVLADDRDGPELEIAIRAWSAQDDDVRATQERVDATRVAYLHRLWEGITGDAARAADLAQLTYLVLVGAHHVVPALAATDVARLYDLILTRFDQEALR